MYIIYIYVAYIYSIFIYIYVYIYISFFFGNPSIIRRYYSFLVPLNPIDPILIGLTKICLEVVAKVTWKRMSWKRSSNNHSS